MRFVERSLRCWHLHGSFLDEFPRCVPPHPLWRSRKVEDFDWFLSHTWLTPGRWKVLSLVVQSCWHLWLASWHLGGIPTFAWGYSMGVSWNGGTPIAGLGPKMDDLDWFGGGTPILGNLHISPTMFATYTSCSTNWTTPACVINLKHTGAWRSASLAHFILVLLKHIEAYFG